MFHGKTRHPAYGDDDPRIVLALRAATEPPPRQWNFFVTGCAVECVLLSLAVCPKPDWEPMPVSLPDLRRAGQ